MAHYNPYKTGSIILHVKQPTGFLNIAQVDILFLKIQPEIQFPNVVQVGDRSYGYPGGPTTIKRMGVHQKPLF